MLRINILLAAGLLAGCGGGEEGPANEAANVVADELMNVVAADANAALPEDDAAAPAAPAAAVNEATTADEPEKAADQAPAGEAEAKAPAPAAPPAASQKAVAMARPAAFAMCQTCHTTGQSDPHRVGPNLFGVVGAKAGSKPGYNFSAAMKESGIVWTRDRLDAFIAAPRSVVPGTKMVIGGPKDAAKRQEIVDYLASLR